MFLSSPHIWKVLPVAVSNVRGNRDLIDPEGGVLFKPDDVSDIYTKLAYLLELSDNKLEKMGAHNQEIVKGFDKNIVQKTMTEIYKNVS